MSSSTSRSMVGSFYGTGASKDIKGLGFRPKYVRLLNIGGLATAEWVKGMADASALKEITAGTKSLITSNGITPLADGFTLGADTDLNVSGELVRYYCSE